MFDLIGGLPVHVLVVHAVVVLLPLAVLGAIATAFSARARRRYGALSIVITLLATVLIPVATSSGEQLERHVGDPGEHAQLGDQLIWFALPLLVLQVALLWLGRRSRSGAVPPPADGRRTGRAMPVVGVLVIVAAVATAVQVYRAGESGARAAWAGQVSARHAGG